MKSVFYILLSCAAIAVAEDGLEVNRSITGDLTSGTSRSYTITLNSGDYAAGFVKQSAKTDLAIFLPDGSQLRRFPGPAQAVARQFAFVAEAPGTYRLELATADSGVVKYELLLSQVLPLDERLKPKT